MRGFMLYMSLCFVLLSGMVIAVLWRFDRLDREVRSEVGRMRWDVERCRRHVDSADFAIGVLEYDQKQRAQLVGDGGMAP